MLDDLEWSGSFLCTDAAPIEHFKVLVKQSYRMKSRCSLMRMFETVDSMNKVLGSVRREKREVHADLDGAPLLNI